MLTPAKAYEIASQWGSLMTNGDPGAVFYTFPINDGRPQSEAHRQQLLDYTFDLIKEERDDTPDDELDPETAERVAELRALWDFFSTSPLGDGVERPEHPNQFHLATDGANGAWAALDAFTQGYIEALFFTECETMAAEAAERHGSERHARELGFADLAPEALARIIEDCERFQHAQLKIQQGRQIFGRRQITTAVLSVLRGPDLCIKGGRDFWYTRNGHGCGFWDGDWPEPYASELTAAAKAFGEVDAYLGYDGKVYLS